MRKGKKGLYRSKIADPVLAGTMDSLRDCYRLKEKMFPTFLAFGFSDESLEKRMIFLSLDEMAQFLVGNGDWFCQPGSIIVRYDEEGNRIKRHVYRELDKQ